MFGLAVEPKARGDEQKHGVPLQDVRETMRDRIHRAGDRHAARLQPPSAPILDGREHAGLDDACRTHVRRSYSMRSIA